MKNVMWLFLTMTMMMVACSEDEDGGDAVTTTDETVLEVNPELFISSGLSTAITKVSCTLSNGTTTTCYQIQTISLPSDHQVGPWCPTKITDGKEKGGIWFEGGKIYDVDGAFIKNMSTFYSDATWLLYNSDGTVKVTNTQAACQAAARPNVDPAYKNYCVECQPAYFPASSVRTFLIPVKPVQLSSTAQVGNMGVIGVALNGVNFDPPAPTQAILGNYTLAPMDDCGGHVNLATGYHYHAATGCTKEVAQSDGHAPMIGYAMDGYGMFAQLNQDGKEPTDLDACRGHYDKTRGYHYHVDKAGANRFIGCFKGAQGTFSIK